MRFIVVVAIAVAIVYSPAPDSAPDLLGRAHARADVLTTYRIAGEVTVQRRGSVSTARLRGQIRDKGPEARPDVWVTVEQDKQKEEFYSVDELTWHRRPGGKWKRGGRTSVVRIADVLSAITGTRTRRTSAGFDIAGTMPSIALNVEGAGRVPVTAMLDQELRLVRLRYRVEMRNALGRDLLATITGTTSYSGFDANFRWPPVPS